MGEESKVETSLNWPKILFLLNLHSFGIYGFLRIFNEASIWTSLFSLILIQFGILGITVGCHRLWAHKTFQANDYLKIFLMICNTIVSQCPIYDWVLDHRLHHKYHGSDNDPYNFKRGFIYCQITSHCLQRSDKKLRDEIDMSDIKEDKIVMFQKKYYWLLVVFFSFLLPIYLPMRIWREKLFVVFTVAVCFRLMVLVEAAWLINSASIVWGLDPNDRKSADTSLIFIVNKSLWPQYHYLLPWDYLSGEYGTYNSGCSTIFIKIMGVLGWAYGMCTITSEGVKEGLAIAVTEDRPVLDCLREKMTVSEIPEILY